MSDFVFEGSDYTIHAPRQLSSMPTLDDTWLGLDTEFTGGGMRVPGGRLRLVQAATESVCIVLDMEENGHQDYARQVLSGRNLFAHNSKAEVGSLFLGLGLDYSRNIFDTLGVAKVCWPDHNTHKVGLKDLAPKLLGSLGDELVRAEEELYELFLRMYIDAGLGTKAASAEKVRAYGFTNVDRRSPVYLRYAGLDAVAERRIGPKLYKIAEQLGVKPPIADELENIGIANRMNLRGWKVSESEAEDIHNGAVKVNGQVAEEFLGITGYKPSSVNKYKDYFAKEFPYVKYNNWNKYTDVVDKTTKEVIGKTRTPKLGGEEVLELAENYPEIAAFEVLSRFKETENIVKFTGTVEKYLDPDFFIHAEINTLGAKTGRWTVKNPGIQTASPKSGARRLFLPNEEDHVLVSADLGQIEPRIAYTLAGCTDLVAQMRMGVDAYTAAAITLFGHNYTSFERKLTKRIVLGSLYAAGIDTLVFQAKYTDGWKDANRDAIKKARDDFNLSIPEVKGLAKKLQYKDFVELTSGRRVPYGEGRVVNGRFNDFRYKGINYLCQGTARDELMLRMRLLSRRGLDKYMLMAMHDELLFSVPVAILREVVLEIREVMEMGFQGTPTPTDIEIQRQSWGDKAMLATDTGLLIPSQREGVEWEGEVPWRTVKTW